MAKLKSHYLVLEVLCSPFFEYSCLVFFYFWPMGSRRWVGTRATGSLPATSFTRGGQSTEIKLFQEERIVAASCSI